MTINSKKNVLIVALMLMCVNSFSNDTRRSLEWLKKNKQLIARIEFVVSERETTFDSAGSRLVERLASERAIFYSDSLDMKIVDLLTDYHSSSATSIRAVCGGIGNSRSEIVKFFFMDSTDIRVQVNPCSMGYKLSVVKINGIRFLFEYSLTSAELIEDRFKKILPQSYSR